MMYVKASLSGSAKKGLKECLSYVSVLINLHPSALRQPAGIGNRVQSTVKDVTNLIKV